MMRNTEQDSIYRCWLSGNQAIYVGRVLDNILHSHYAIQICFGIEGDIRVADEGGREIAGRLVIVPSNFPHRLVPDGGRVMYMYLDPLGIHALQAVGSGACPGESLATFQAFDDFDGQLLWDCLNDRNARPFLRALPALQAAARIPETLSARQPSFGPGFDPRVRQIAETLRREPDRDLSDLARAVRLSSSRTRHLFKAELGLGTRRFRLWARMLVAIHAVAEGASLIDAANLAGFADQAHFNRTMKTAFGITPTQLLTSPRIELELV